MVVWISGQALSRWRCVAQQNAMEDSLPPGEVDWLLQYCTNLDRLSLRLGLFEQIPQVFSIYSLEELNQLWNRRLVERCPLQYLVGVAPWRHFLLNVSPAVLIPRPETELLIDRVLDQVGINPGKAKGDWVDLGTGTGAIALGLASVLPEARIHAVDQSGEALAIAVANAQKYHLSDRIQFYQGSWWEPLTKLRGNVQGMISNPPYIPSSELAKLQPEVYDHEPHLALDGGKDGLDAIRYLINSAPNYLQSQSLWGIEVMAGQARIIQQLLSEQGDYEEIQIFKDLADVERFVFALRR